MSHYSLGPTVRTGTSSPEKPTRREASDTILAQLSAVVMLVLVATAGCASAPCPDYVTPSGERLPTYRVQGGHCAVVSLPLAEGLWQMGRGR